MKFIKDSNALYPLGGYQNILKESKLTMIRCGKIVLMFNQHSCLVVNPPLFQAS